MNRVPVSIHAEILAGVLKGLDEIKAKADKK